MKHKDRTIKACIRVVWISSFLQSPTTTSMHNQHWQTHPRPVPAVLLAIIWGLPWPEALEEPCQWCDNWFCSPFCVRQQDRYGPSQEHSWGPGPSQTQRRIEFPQAGTLYSSQTKNESSDTISKDGYTRLDPGMAWINANDTRVGKV